MSDSSAQAAMRPEDAGQRAGVYYVAAILPMLLIEWQRSQWAALVACQNAVTALNQELSNAWVCRWGGGVPIDA